MTTVPSQGPVLIVEDDADIAGTMVDFLTEEGFTVSVANDGEDGLTWLRTGPRPCVILLDLMMPRLDGFGFRARQVADPRLADIPVVLCTAGGHARRNAEALGLSETLPKPFDLEALLSVVRAHCTCGPGSA